ncbi:MAG: hypothetical protein DME51_03265 [Verrucomicrobia bacterium]|nr:MAG: hypothetical protein DME51_03265 [Verrucomicrobiota bacterium]
MFLGKKFDAAPREYPLFAIGDRKSKIGNIVVPVVQRIEHSRPGRIRDLGRVPDVPKRFADGCNNRACRGELTSRVAL